jgi:heme exporter protein A
VLFRGLNLTVGSGQGLWLRGRNGSGKTTLLRVLAGLAHAHEGRCEWRLAEAGAAHGAPTVSPTRTLYIGHRDAMKGDLRAHEALRFVARLHGDPDDDTAIDSALEQLALHTHRQALVRTLSQGQRRRLALARLALALRAVAADDSAPARSVWLLDEPYDALDADGCNRLDSLLHAQRSRGGAVVLTSHITASDALAACDVLDLDAQAVKAKRTP